MKCHINNYSIAGAIFSALGMFLMSVLNYFGLYVNAVQQMQEWHMFYTPDIAGTIAGMIEAAIWTYVSISVFLLIHKKICEIMP